MEKRFKLNAHNTSASKEILCGITTFLTMSYILFMNPAIVSQSGMPASGLFVATVLVASIGSFVMGFAANVPFGVAPGMGLNALFTYTICLGMGFAWQEGLALVFTAGVLHLLVMLTGMRKSLVGGIPHHLKMAFGAGLGIFIGYVGLKNAGLLMFTTPPGQYQIFSDGTVLSNSSAVPGLAGVLGGQQIIALTGLGVMLVLLALERKTGDSYAALPIGILTATFVGIPMNVTDILGAQFFDFGSVLEFRAIAFAFWGDPGLVSIIAAPEKLLRAFLLVLVLLVINVMDSVGTIIGIGQVQGAEVFSDEDMRDFEVESARTKLDKSLMCNSVGGSLAALLGCTTATAYMESITGIVAGGRTGLAAVTIGVMFLLCLPLVSFISVIPAAAIAPALIVAGVFMIPLATRIDWANFEEAFPAFATIMCIPLAYSFAHGIAAGVLSHVVIQAAVGKWRKVHPMLYVIAAIFVVVIIAEARF